MQKTLLRKGIAFIVIILFIEVSIPSMGNASEYSTILKSNNPPYVPSDPLPENGSTDVNTDYLSWTGGDPDPDDIVTYKVYFGDETNPPYIDLIGPFPANWTNFLCDIGQSLEYCTTYYWRIVAEDNNGAITKGPLWSFTTIGCSGKTLYVGGSGEGNYTKIQDAIDNASDGDTVYVYNGTYVENVVVNKSIRLIGEDKNKTVVDGSDKEDIVYVSADWVTISNFKIQNSGNRWYDAGIDISSNYNNISDNKIISNNSGQGIYLYHSDSNRIIGNTLSNNEFGIEFEGSNHNTITNNNISNNGVGIFGVPWQSSSYNTIIDNTISNNAGVGIQLDCSSNHNTITGNTICSNDISGITLNGSSNILSCNTITNGDCGICLEGYRNNVTSNTILNNNDGLYLYYSSNNIFLKNNVLDNKRDAFFINTFINQWKQNYWNKPRIFPKLIFGIIRLDNLTIPWFNIDWNPASEPYDI